MPEFDAVKLAKEKLGASLFECLELSFESKENEPLKVTRDGNKVSIVYSKKCMLFRGLTIVKEHINEQKYELILNKHFKHNGYMVDCSRNGVANLKTLKEIILTQALMGQDRLLLYTEDTYKLDKYPWFGYLRGGYTKEEIKELVAFGEEFGVELVPCIQTLGHLKRPLRWEPMIPLRDGETTLLADDEKAYEFIEEMIKFSRECFKSTDIHIGMDESTEMGLGRYLQFHKYTDRVELFSRHLDRVISICKKYDFKPMIWSDMYFRLNTKDEEYYRDSPLPASTLKLIPNSISLVYWDYYHDQEKTYDDMISYHKDAKRNIVFAGGAWRWKGFVPSIEKSLEFSTAAMNSCVKNGIDDVFVTAWGDNGNECSLTPTFPVIALYSCADYFGNTDKENVNSLVKAVCGESLDDFILMDLPDRPGGKCLLPQYNPHKFLLYQDPLNGIFDKQIKDEFVENYKKYSLILKNKAKESKNFGYVYEILAALCDCLEIKADLGVRLRKYYKEGNKAGLKQIAKKDVPLLIKRLDKLNDLAYFQWNKENKPFGFDVVNGRIGYLKNRVSTVNTVVMEYLNGKTANIAELETEILPFNGHDFEVCWNWWIQTCTVHDL